jgi:hypothetical protein
MTVKRSPLAPNVGVEITGISGHELVDRGAADDCPPERGVSFSWAAVWPDDDPTGHTPRVQQTDCLRRSSRLRDLRS